MGPAAGGRARPTGRVMHMTDVGIYRLFTGLETEDVAQLFDVLQRNRALADELGQKDRARHMNYFIGYCRAELQSRQTAFESMRDAGHPDPAA